MTESEISARSFLADAFGKDDPIIHDPKVIAAAVESIEFGEDAKGFAARVMPVVRLQRRAAADESKGPAWWKAVDLIRENLGDEAADSATVRAMVDEVIVNESVLWNHDDLLRKVTEHMMRVIAARDAAKVPSMIREINDDEAVLAHAARTSGAKVTYLRPELDPDDAASQPPVGALVPSLSPAALSNSLKPSGLESVEMQKFRCVLDHEFTSHAGNYVPDGLNAIGEQKFRLERFASTTCPIVTDADHGLVCANKAYPIKDDGARIVTAGGESADEISTETLVQIARSIPPDADAGRLRELAILLGNRLERVKDERRPAMPNEVRVFDEVAVAKSVERTQALIGTGARRDELVHGESTGVDEFDLAERFGAIPTAPHARIEVVRADSRDPRLSDVNLDGIASVHDGAQYVALWYAPAARYPTVAAAGPSAAEAMLGVLRVKLEAEAKAAKTGPVLYDADGRAPGLVFRDGDVAAADVTQRALESRHVDDGSL